MTKCLLDELPENYQTIMNNSAPYWTLRLALSDDLEDLRGMRTIRRIDQQHHHPQISYDESDMMAIISSMPTTTSMDLDIASSTHSIVGEAHGFTGKYVTPGYCTQCLLYSQEMKYNVIVPGRYRPHGRHEFIVTLGAFLHHINLGCTMREEEA